MAHKIRVKFIPGKNKDGKPSKTKGEWVATDHTRGKTKEIFRFDGTVKDKSRADEAVAEYRDDLYHDHIEAHPNDVHYVEKHGR